MAGVGGDMKNSDQRFLYLLAIIPAFVTAELRPVQLAVIRDPVDFLGRFIDKNTDDLRAGV